MLRQHPSQCLPVVVGPAFVHAPPPVNVARARDPLSAHLLLVLVVSIVDESLRFHHGLAYRTALGGAEYAVLLPIGSPPLLEASSEPAPPETP